MDFTSDKTSWIWSYKNGSALNPNSQSANLNQHNVFGTFTFDLTKARGGSSLNPFVEALTIASPSNNGSSTPASTAGSSATTGSASSSTSVSENNGTDSNGDELKVNRATTAHGTIMGITFVIIFPLGALLIRLCSF